MDRVRVAGGGLAGVEAAYFLARNGISADLFEMRPHTMTPAHKTDLFAELVCSNSFKGTDPFTAHGMLKREMTELGSLVLAVARETKVPAGKALAVDRTAFARDITGRIAGQPLITIRREEFTSIGAGVPTIIATGPLTSDALVKSLAGITGSGRLSFYDAISPIVDADSIDMDQAFYGARWSEGSDDYLNCPMDEDLYHRFVEELLRADRVKAHAFEDARYFDACLPVEVVAGRGKDALRFGNMRPVGLDDPATGKRPFAVVQLRRENLKGDAYTLVGFQTRLTFPEQEKIIRMIPALSHARLLRHGSIHRNTYLDSPRIIRKDLSLKECPDLFLAGQITGVEGYMESAATGILSGISLLARLKGKCFTPPGADTACGALIHFITDETAHPFQPTNINFGIMERVDAPKNKRNEIRSEQAARSFAQWKQELKDIL
jgi:methylenetetrahydrofolate--tRNA-(uracil-5-)-methyltransferase